MHKLSERKPKNKSISKSTDISKREYKPRKVDYPEPLDFDNIKLLQTDLWFMHRYFFGEDTRLPKKDLLPKFTNFFNKKNNEMDKKS